MHLSQNLLQLRGRSALCLWQLNLVLDDQEHNWQRSFLLYLAQEIARCDQIAINNRKLEEWRQTSEMLLYALIPKSIANRLKNGEDPINTCQVSDPLQDGLGQVHVITQDNRLLSKVNTSGRNPCFFLSFVALFYPLGPAKSQCYFKANWLTVSFLVALLSAKQEPSLSQTCLFAWKPKQQSNKGRSAWVPLMLSQKYTLAFDQIILSRHKGSNKQVKLPVSCPKNLWHCFFPGR